MTHSLEVLRRHAVVIGLVLMFLLTWPTDLANWGGCLFGFPHP
jgi:hypothetical protein